MLGRSGGTVLFSPATAPPTGMLWPETGSPTVLFLRLMTFPTWGLWEGNVRTKRCVACPTSATSSELVELEEAAEEAAGSTEARAQGRVGPTSSHGAAASACPGLAVLRSDELAKDDVSSWIRGPLRLFGASCCWGMERLESRPGTLEDDTAAISRAPPDMNKDRQRWGKTMLGVKLNKLNGTLHTLDCFTVHRSAVLCTHWEELCTRKETQSI